MDRYLKLYLELGFAVIPAIYGKKRPEVDWKEYQTKAPTESQVKKWFKIGRHNIAILCGRPSGNLAVLDFDKASVYPKAFDTSKLEKETIVVKTGSGKPHVYLRSDKPVPSFRVPQIGLEVRSERNVVIAPPSLHPSGGHYQFVNPDVQTVITVDDLVKSVWSLAEKLGVKKPVDLFKEEAEEWEGAPYEGPNPPCILNILKGVEEGVRNEAAVRLATYWMRFKQTVDPGRALGRLKYWNRRNKPPLPEAELKNVVESAKKLERSYGCHLNQAWCDLERCSLMRNKLLRAEAEQEAEKILSETNVLEAGKPHLDNILVGEDENKQLEFVLLSSGKVEDPALRQFILLKSEAGAGKTHLMRLASAFKVKDVGRFSAHALDYSDLQDYEVLRLKELGAMDQEFQGVSTIKFLSPEDRGYVVEVTERDKRGRFTTKQYRVPPITLITSTTRVILDPQFERRSWILNPDESKEQTERIGKWKANHEREKGLVSLGLLKETSYDHSLRILRAIAKKLEPCKVVLPFPESLTKILKAERLRVRGDFDKIFGLVKLHAFLHQRSLPTTIGKDATKVVLCTPQQAISALKMAEKPYVTMAMELEERSRRLLDVLKDLGITLEGDVIDKEKRDKIAVKLGRSSKTVARYLSEWVNSGYMSASKTTSRGRPTEFKLLYPLEDIEKKASASLDITKMSEEISLNLKEEAEQFLERFGTKISYGMDWTPEKVREVLTTIEISRPWENFVRKESESETREFKQKKPASLDISPMVKETKLSIRELIVLLRASFTRGTQQDFERLAKESGGLTDKEAEDLFNKLVGDGSLCMDPHGWWRWV